MNTVTYSLGTQCEVSGSHVDFGFRRISVEAGFEHDETRFVTGLECDLLRIHIELSTSTIANDPPEHPGIALFRKWASEPDLEPAGSWVALRDRLDENRKDG